MSNSFWQFKCVFLCSFVLQWIDAQTPNVYILTSECRRILGSEVVIRGTFNTIPRDPVRWLRDGLSVASCEPDKACDTPKNGYSISQNNSGLNYTIVIQSVNNTDDVNWTFRELYNDTPFNLALLAVNLTTVHVFCDWPQNETIVVKSGSTHNVKCSTECIPGSSILTFSLEHNIGTDVGFQNSSSSVSCATGGDNRTSTIVLDNTQGQQSGDYTLCYVLTDGGCIETLECKALVFEPTTTTIPPTPTTTGTSPTVPNTTNTTSQPTEPTTTCTPPPEPECALIAVVVLACILLLGSITFITFLGIQTKKGVTGSCRNGVIAALGTTVGLSVLVVILVVLELENCCFKILRNSQPQCAIESESASGISGLGISGITLFALAGIAFIVASVIYCKHRQPAGKENDKEMTSTNEAS